MTDPCRICEQAPSAEVYCASCYGTARAEIRKLVDALRKEKALRAEAEAVTRIIAIRQRAKCIEAMHPHYPEAARRLTKVKLVVPEVKL